MLSIGKILFIILMPIVFKLLEAIMEDNYIYNISIGRIIFEIFQVLIYYGMEAVYIFVHHSITNEWIFTKNNSYSTCFSFFVFCSVGFIICSIFLCDSNNIVVYHVGKLFILFILYAIFLAIIDSNITEDIFNNMEYEKTNEEIISLKAFSDTRVVNGEIHGGMFYISGKIQEDYELYYAFIAEDDSLTIRHFTYNETHCKIFLEKKCKNPRIEIKTYAKSYKNNNSNYCDYVIYIPDDSVIGYEIDLQ